MLDLRKVGSKSLPFSIGLFYLSAFVGAATQAGQADLNVIETTLEVEPRSKFEAGKKQYLSSFYWVENNCNDNRVQLWGDTSKTLDHKWRFEPVPLSTIQAEYPRFDESEPLYYLKSVQKEDAPALCASKYLTRLLDCGRNPVVLHTGKDEKGAQWWSPVPLGDGTFAIENFYSKKVCVGNSYLITNHETFAKMHSKFADESSFVGKWSSHELPILTSVPESGPLDHEELTVNERWVRACSPGGKCSVTVGDTFSISKGMAKAWSKQLETSISSTLSASTTVGVEAESPVAKASASATVSTSITAGLTAAVSREKSSTSGTTRESDRTFACEYSTPAGKFGYFHEVDVIIGGEKVTMKSCDFACGRSQPSFDAGSGEHADSCF